MTLVREDGSFTRAGMRALTVGQLVKFVSDTYSMCGVEYATLETLRAAVLEAIDRIQLEKDHGD